MWNKNASNVITGSKKKIIITGLNEILIKRFAIILQAISCGEMIDTKRIGEYAMETAKMFIQDYGWYYDFFCS